MITLADRLKQGAIELLKTPAQRILETGVERTAPGAAAAGVVVGTKIRETEAQIEERLEAAGALVGKTQAEIENRIRQEKVDIEAAIRAQVEGAVGLVALLVGVSVVGLGLGIWAKRKFG